MPKSASYAFYLAVFGIFTGECHARTASRASTYSNPAVCALEPKAKVSDACASYAELDALNHRLYPAVRDVANNTDFFAYYRLNLYNKKCPFWSDEDGMCGNIACAVTTLENEADIPAIWRAEELSKLEGPKAQHPGRQLQAERPARRPLQGELGEGVGESCVVEFDDECDERDYCVPEDESASAKGDYVSLADNPERFTGYAGEGAHQVWEAIYRENCFSRPVNGAGPKSAVVSAAAAPPSAAGLLKKSQNKAKASMDFKQVMKDHDRRQQARGEAGAAGLFEESLEFEDECVEKRVFYRIISGMHASISTHLCHEYLNQTTGEWSPNLQCYRERLHNHPERLSNLYFNYALVLRAVGKLRDHVQEYTFCTGDTVEDARTKQLVRSLAHAIPAGPTIFDERTMFQDQSATGISLKEDFRNRFRNVSRIMDCVGCDKCRLWGKIQTNGLGTALKVLFEFPDEDGDEVDSSPLSLRRTELVALVNTLDKISAALKAVEGFRDMIAAEVSEEENLTPIPTPRSSETSSTSSVDDIEERKAEASAAGHYDALAEDLTNDIITNSNNNNNNNNNLFVSKADEDIPATPDSFAEEPPLGEVVQSELTLVIETMWFIIKSWAQLPQTLGRIAIVELARAWDSWLGRPVIDHRQHSRSRSWELAWPGREELRAKVMGRQQQQRGRQEL